MPIRISDDDYVTIARAAEPVPPQQRGDFLRSLAIELERHPVIGPGLVHRLAAELQARFTVETRAQARWGNLTASRFVRSRAGR
jgi:hypothetical protein